MQSAKSLNVMTNVKNELNEKNTYNYICTDNKYIHFSNDLR